MTLFGARFITHIVVACRPPCELQRIMWPYKQQNAVPVLQRSSSSRACCIFVEKSMEGISCMDQLHDVHHKLVRTIPDANTMLSLCAQLEKNQGRSSQRLTNAMQNCDPKEFDKVWPGEERIINIGQCCSFAPLDTSDVGRMAHKLTLFPDDFMERLRILVGRVQSSPQKSYGNLISNFPLAVYLCLFQKIAKSELGAIVDMAQNGDATCQLVLSVPNLIQFHEWKVTTREWNRENVNREKTGDDTDIFIDKLMPSAERFDVRSVLGDDFLHSFLSSKLKVLMNKKIAANWLSFTGAGNTLGNAQTSEHSSERVHRSHDWQYGKVIPFDAKDATVKIRIVVTMVEGNPRKLISLPPSYTLWHLKASVEEELRMFGCQPCEFLLYHGFPSSVIENDDATSVERFHNGVVTVRCAK